MKALKDFFSSPKTIAITDTYDEVAPGIYVKIS